MATTRLTSWPLQGGLSQPCLCMWRIRRMRRLDHLTMQFQTAERLRRPYGRLPLRHRCVTRWRLGAATSMRVCPARKSITWSGPNSALGTRCAWKLMLFCLSVCWLQLVSIAHSRTLSDPVCLSVDRDATSPLPLLTQQFANKRHCLTAVSSTAPHCTLKLCCIVSLSQPTWSVNRCEAQATWPQMFYSVVVPARLVFCLPGCFIY